MAGAIIAGSPCMMKEAETATALTSAATDRSMEATRMTKVCPSATKPSATMRCSRPTTPSKPSWLAAPVARAATT